MPTILLTDASLLLLGPVILIHLQILLLLLAQKKHLIINTGTNVNYWGGRAAGTFTNTRFSRKLRHGNSQFW